MTEVDTSLTHEGLTNDDTPPPTSAPPLEGTNTVFCHHSFVKTPRRDIKTTGSFGEHRNRFGWTTDLNDKLGLADMKTFTREYLTAESIKPTPSFVTNVFGKLTMGDEWNPDHQDTRHFESESSYRKRKLGDAVRAYLDSLGEWSKGVIVERIRRPGFSKIIDTASTDQWNAWTEYCKATGQREYEAVEM